MTGHGGRGIFDVAVIGAGAAGMMAASVAGQRGLRVVLIDHARKLAEKIRISGGGRCNFTNMGTGSANFLSRNPKFCRSALAGYTPQDFIALVRSHGISWHEKHKGQLFCDDSSESIITMLEHECRQGGVTWRMPCSVEVISREDDRFTLATSQGSIRARQLVMACGGMALPQVGATDFALTVARQFSIKVIEPRPALVPLTFDSVRWQSFAGLSGVSLPVASSCGAGRTKTTFLEDLLFTHRGLSGPAILQISSFWNPGEPIFLNLAPQRDLQCDLIAAKPGNRQRLDNVLGSWWPKRLAQHWLADSLEPGMGERHLADVPDRLLRVLATGIHDWSLVPSGTAGYKKAEVMRGGIDTAALDQKSMHANAVPGLYFIGEAVDVTGWLGGYNFQWAWASGVACGRALT